jgi:hypothetical protein
MSLSLQWLVRRGPAVLPELLLIDQDGSAQSVSAPEGDPADWRSGALMVVPYTFRVSETLADVAIRVGDIHYRLPLRIVEAPPPVANFGNLIRLRSYAYEQDVLQAGDMLRLLLEWEAADAVPEPYKVFVHVLGHNGLPVAQQDNEPVNGTYPTTRWQRGERVSDRYAFSLPGGLSPGEYQVEVGLYRISDLSRLPVLDGNLAVTDDKVFLTPITVGRPQ